MGLTVRYFWLDARDEVHRIAARKWHRVIEGDDPMPAFADQRVTIVQAIVHVDGRDVIEVMQLDGWRHAFDTRGYWDRTRGFRGAGLVLDSLEWADLMGQPTNVRTIVPRIAERRVAEEFRVMLTVKQRDAVLRAIWKA
jgi:hypothetical protein